MDSHDFMTQIKRLKDTYGDRLYTSERIESLWKLLKDWEVYWLANAITHFIDTERQAPLIPEFKGAIKFEQERHAEKTRMQLQQLEDDLSPNENACIYCGDSGVLMCIHEKKTGFWAFKCDCSFGKSDPRSFPVLKTGHLEQGFQYLTKDQFLLLRGKSESQKQSYAKEAG